MGLNVNKRTCKVIFLALRLVKSIIPFNVAETGALGFPARPHTTLLTLKWHKTALVVSCRSEQVVVVVFVTTGQIPQSESMLYVIAEQLEAVQENTSLPGWTSAR